MICRCRSLLSTDVETETTLDHHQSPWKLPQLRLKLLICEKNTGERFVFSRLRVYLRSQVKLLGEESDEFYELTPADYHLLLATKKEDKSLKTRKLREAEEAARRANLTKAVIRVRFPDNHTLEATFHPSEKIQSLVDLLKRALAHPEVPFYLYTTPPKKQIKDFSQDFYSAGFVPGAIVYFANDQPKDAAAISTPYLNEEILSLKDIEVMTKEEEPVEPSSEPASTDAVPVPVEQEPKPAEKKTTKPKWFKM